MANSAVPLPCASLVAAEGSRTVVEDIAAERRRQMQVEGWTSKHDDTHTAGQMAAAAGTYGIGALLPGEQDRVFQRYWPWDRASWKPRNARRDLVRAAALIVAEIERLDRIEASKSSPGGWPNEIGSGL